jgi:hypothetical protein
VADRHDDDRGGDAGQDVERLRRDVDEMTRKTSSRTTMTKTSSKKMTTKESD